MLIHRFLKAKRGNASLEFAISSAAIFAMLLGIVEGGRLFMNQYELDAAVNNAARYAIVHGANSTTPATVDVITNIVKTSAGPGMAGNIEVNVSFPSGNNPGNPVSIAAGYTWKPVTTIANMFEVNLSSQAVLTIQN